MTNWREYERGLRSRGDITVWFSEEAREARTLPKDGRRGGQPRYSNLAIVTALTLRMVFHLPLRQTEGFLDSLLRLMELDLKAPDHTKLSRPNKDVDVVGSRLFMRLPDGRNGATRQAVHGTEWRPLDR